MSAAPSAIGGDDRLLGVGFVAGDGAGGSGGDVRFFEILRRVAGSRPVVLLTSPGGLAMARRFGLRADVRVIADARGPLLVAGVRSIVDGLRRLPVDLRGFSGTVYTSSDHLYDCLPAAYLARRNGARWAAVNHWVEELPWRDDRGGTAALPRYLYWAQRRAARALMRRYADRVLAVSATTRQKLLALRGFGPERVHEVLCGVDVDPPLARPPAPPDAVFMKRWSPGKGIFDLVPIWREVVAHRPDARLAVAGGGTADVEVRLRDEVRRAGLERNIELVGSVEAVADKYGLLGSASLFLLPSHEENWAIVIGEAMAAGTPVVAYDLPELRAVWGDDVAWVRRGDRGGFARRVLALLDDPAARAALAEAGRARVATLSWNRIAEREAELLAG